MGLMQLMPATARQFGVAERLQPGGERARRRAVSETAARSLRNNEELALAAYNAGPGAVDQHGRPCRLQASRELRLRVNRMAGHRVETHGAGIYKVTEVIDGREVVKYTDKKPTP